MGQAAVLESIGAMELADYRYLAVDPEMLGGQPYINGTRLSAAFVLSCLSQGLTVDEIRRPTFR
jgi:uncharacterized protein (DUF433 family)